MRVPRALQVLIISIILVLVFRVDREINPVDQKLLAIPKFEGLLAANDALNTNKANVFAKNIPGPEDVVFHPNGTVFFTGSSDGWIYAVDAQDSSKPPVKWVYTNGRPLGMVFDNSRNRLIVADIVLGLIAVELETKDIIHLATTTSDGVPINFADDVTVAKNGVVYLTDATTRRSLTPHEVLVNSILEVAEGRGTGRVVRYDPETKQATTLIGSLVFANGIALSKDEDYLFIGDLGRFRILKYWLKGPKAGTHEVFGDGNMVGFPDGIQTDEEDGSLWVSIYGPRDEFLQMLLECPICVRLAGQLPDFVLVKASVPKPYTLILHYDVDGNLIESFHGSDKGSVAVTSVNRRGNKLYLGALVSHGIKEFTINRNK